MLKTPQNPLFATEPEDMAGEDENGIAFDCKKLKSPHVTRGKVKTGRELKKLMRKETAAEAIGDLYPDCAIFGITKGQFSLIELISAVLEQTGPADVFLSTWTAAGSDLSDAFALVESGLMNNFKCLVDHTFQRRKPAFAAKIRELFGIESVRVTRNHAKFVLIRNPKWNLVIQTSMNLNFNPRLEDFSIEDDAGKADFLQGIADEIFKRIKPRALFETDKLNDGRFKTL